MEFDNKMTDNIIRFLRFLNPIYEKKKIQLLINTIEESDVFNNTSKAKDTQDYLVQIELISFEIKQTIDMVNAPSHSPLYNMMNACLEFQNKISANQFLNLDLLLQSAIIEDEQQKLKDSLVRYMNSLSMFHNINVKCAFQPQYKSAQEGFVSCKVFPMR